MTNLSEKYLILNHSKEERDKTRVAGVAYRMEDDGCFLLRLRILPVIRYYLVQQKNDPQRFLIFSGMSKVSGKCRFFYQIGEGSFSYRADVIELKFPDLNQTYYMQIDGREDQPNSNAAA